MLAKVQKLGSSLALMIPEEFAHDARLDNDSVVDMAVAEGQIIITLVASPMLRLENLLAGVNKDNLHGETDTGAAIGKEVW